MKQRQYRGFTIINRELSNPARQREQGYLFYSDDFPGKRMYACTLREAKADIDRIMLTTAYVATKA
jgi:hypothetical protein